MNFSFFGFGRRERRPEPTPAPSGNRPVSDLFVRIFRAETSTPLVTCACGQVHYKPRAAELDGYTFVADCPCGHLARYEQFLIEHKNEIIVYLLQSSQLDPDSNHDLEVESGIPGEAATPAGVLTKGD